MHKASSFFPAIIALLTLYLQPSIASAADIKFLCATIMRPVMEEVLKTFESSTVHKVTVEYGTAGALRERIRKGEEADLTILPQPMIDALQEEAKLMPGSKVVVARATVSVAVRAGAPKPDISSVAAFRRSLLAASSIAYADPATGSASGVHFARVLDQLGIAAEIRHKSILIKDGVSVDAAARGKAEVAIAGTPGLMKVAGVDFVGPLPSELQNIADFVYVAAVPSNAKQPNAAQLLVRFLRRPDTTHVIKAKGMAPG